MKRFHIRNALKRITFPKVMLYLFMIAMVTFTALPLVYVLNTAFKPLDELFLFPPRFLVQKPTFTNFSDLLLALGSNAVPFTRYFFNSAWVTIVTVCATVFVSSMGAYAITKLKPFGSKVLFTIVVAALMFSPHVTKIPSYMVVNGLGLIDTYLALILPQIAVAYNIFLMKQFAEQFPNEVLEAGRIDGASEFKLFWKVVMPALAPAWSTLIVFSFVSNWNDYFSPLIYITDQAMRTLPLALRTIGGGGVAALGRAGAVAASSLVMITPTVILFTILQGKVMETMTYSGIKG